MELTIEVINELKAKAERAMTEYRDKNRIFEIEKSGLRVNDLVTRTDSYEGSIKVFRIIRFVDFIGAHDCNVTHGVCATLQGIKANGQPSTKHIAHVNIEYLRRQQCRNLIEFIESGEFK